MISLRDRIEKAATRYSSTAWDEQKHPRDEGGQFAVVEATKRHDWEPENPFPMSDSVGRAVRSQFVQELEDSDLTRDKKVNYLTAIQGVLQRMPTKALQSMKANVRMVVFYPNTQLLTIEFIGRLQTPGVVGGVWEPLAHGAAGALHLDGGFHNERKPGVTPQKGIYAHEFGHAVDWAGSSPISETTEWKEAFKAELSLGQLTDYATTHVAEGFAEFARLNWATEETPAQIRGDFPKCYSVFKQHGLV